MSFLSGLRCAICGRLIGNSDKHLLKYGHYPESRK